MGQRLCCSAADAGRWGERGHGAGFTPFVWLSSIALLPWLPSLPPQASPTTVSSFTSPRPVSPQSAAALPWDCSRIPKLQLPATAPSRGPVSLSRVCMSAARTVWFSFHLDCRRSAISLSALNVSPLTQTVAPVWGSDPCFSSPTSWGQVQSYWHSWFSPWLLCPIEFCVVLYILFLWSGPPDHSQLLFCMHFCVWRCVPDVSVERDVLHVHLLLRHLVLA